MNVDFLLDSLVSYRICGQVGTVPPFQWFVDDLQHPEDVSIIMKNIGLNDGADEGIGFTLSGIIFLKRDRVQYFII